MTQKKQNFQKGSRQKFVKVKTAKGRKLSSTQWLQRQLNDPFINLAKERNYKSRAAFKLIEIDEKYNLVKKAKVIIDLGCAPGGWLQVSREINHKAKILGLDLLDIDLVPQTDFIQGDFLEKDIKAQLLEYLKGRKIDLVLSDIAPATCGHKDTDHARLMVILEDVLAFLKEQLNEGGSFVTKVFFGYETDQLRDNYKKHFKEVKFFKPESSRKESKEQYMVCRNFKATINKE